MTAAAVAALTVYDMVKGVERGVSIETVELLEKTRRAQRHLAPRRQASRRQGSRTVKRPTTRPAPRSRRWVRTLAVA